jgi:hypothetical protein
MEQELYSSALLLSIFLFMICIIWYHINDKSKELELKSQTTTTRRMCQPETFVGQSTLYGSLV